jgi:dual specificity protein phosphatase 1B
MNHLSLILPSLYISDWESSQDLDLLASNKIGAILTLETRHRNPQILEAFKRAGIQYHQIFINDDPVEDIKRFFDETNNYIRSNISLGKNVLVNCWAGVSRSVTIVMAFLTSKLYEKCPPLDEQTAINAALNKIREGRPIAHPNGGFVGQVYEKAKEYNSNCQKHLSEISSNTKTNHPMTQPAAPHAMQLGATNQPPAQEANIIYLTNDDFDPQGNLVNFAGINGVVLFFSHGCGHCRKMMPEYEKLASALTQNPTTRALAVDTGKHRDLMTRLNPAAFGYAIRGVPAVVGYNKGKFYSEYADDDPSAFRTAQSLLQYAMGIGTSPIVMDQ